MAITLQPSDLIFEFASNGMDDIHQVQPPEHGAQSTSADNQIDTDRQTASEPADWQASQSANIDQAPTRFRALGPLVSQTVPASQSVIMGWSFSELVAHVQLQSTCSH